MKSWARKDEEFNVQNIGNPLQNKLRVSDRRGLGTKTPRSCSERDERQEIFVSYKFQVLFHV